MDTNWVTLLASNDRRGGTSAARVKAPNELIWKVELPEAVRSSPILRDGVIHVTSRNGRLYALDSKTGRERWVFQAAAAIDSTPSISGDFIFFGCDDGAVYAVDRMSGRMRWKAEGAGPIWTSPTIHNDFVYIGSTDGTFKAADRTTGKTRWSRQLEGQICSTAYAADRLVYFGSSNGRIHALEASSGKDAWLHQAGDGVTASPAVADGLVLAGSEDFVFYALDAESGKVRWKVDTESRNLLLGSRGGREGVLRRQRRLPLRAEPRGWQDSSGNRSRCGRSRPLPWPAMRWSACRRSTVGRRRSTRAPERDSGARTSAAHCSPRRS